LGDGSGYHSGQGLRVDLDVEVAAVDQVHVDKLGHPLHSVGGVGRPHLLFEVSFAHSLEVDLAIP
jgi:hypothetical protein